MIKPGSVIGIVGGGQLGRMTAIAAANLGYRSHIYTPEKAGPAEQVSHRVTIAPYDDREALRHFSQNVDVMTFEFENIPYETLKMLEAQGDVRPGANVLHIAQHRLREKGFMRERGIATTPYKAVTSAVELKQGLQELGYPCILKTVEMGYDGKGQFVIREGDDVEALWRDNPIGTGILEAFVDYVKEVSVVVARGLDKTVLAYPVVENIHKNGILAKTIAPAEIDPVIAKKARDIACKIAEELDLCGVVAVEFFVRRDGEVLVNEIAPRPHNSGHWTIDACVTSQFEQLVRAVCGLPLGSVDILAPAVMVNLIGHEVDNWQHYLQDPHAKLHLYGKLTAREGRKMGHVTTLALSK